MGEVGAVIGGIVGGVSLAIQLTDECIKTYYYLSEASHMPESLRYLQVRLQMEQQRFLNFALEAGLLYADGELCAALKVNRTVFEIVLDEVKTALEAFEKKQERYSDSAAQTKKVDWNDHGEPEINLMDLYTGNPQGTSRKNSHETPSVQGGSLLRGVKSLGTRASSKAKKLGTILTEPKRFSWASVDKSSLEDLVSRLKTLNSFLISLLDAAQITKLEKSVESGYMEMLQIRNDLKDLRILVEALTYDFNNRGPSPAGFGLVSASQRSAFSNKEGHSDAQNKKHLKELTIKIGQMDIDMATQSVEEDHSDAQNKEHLKELTTIKIDRMEIDMDTQSVEDAGVDASSSELDMSEAFNIHASDKVEAQELPQEREIFNWDGQRVWIEWMGPRSSQWTRPEGGNLIETRVRLLAKLLRRGLPSTFHSPRCAGYVKSRNADAEVAFGLVFEQPTTVNQGSSFMTLRQLLGQRPKPSLTNRVGLATTLSECVQSFHSVSWLHKGLRSHNVLFFCEDAARFDAGMAYVTGFELSRPNDSAEMTVKPDADPIQDMYRHPHAQSDKDRPYRKCYDLYSMGILFFEIIHWRPIEDILQLQPPITRASLVRRVKDRLLGQEEDEDDNEPVLTGPNPGQFSYLEEIAERGGDVYRSAVELCLTADEVEKAVYKGERATAIDQRLRLAFDEQVVNRLQVMKQALEVLD